MSDTGKRIKDLREERGISRAKLGRAVGISPSAIGQIETGTTKNPNPVNLLHIARMLNVSPEYLITGKGDVRAAVSMVPVIGWEDIMKPSAERETEDWIPRPKDAPLDRDVFGLIVHGESMSNPNNPSEHYPNGSYIYVDPIGGKTAQPGDYVIARLEASKTLVFKQYMVEDNSCFLRPTNPAFPLIFEAFTIVAKVIGVYQYRRC